MVVPSAPPSAEEYMALEKMCKRNYQFTNYTECKNTSCVAISPNNHTPANTNRLFLCTELFTYLHAKCRMHIITLKNGMHDYKVDTVHNSAPKILSSSYFETTTRCKELRSSCQVNYYLAC